MKQRETLRYVFRYLRPYIGFLVLSLLLSAATVGLTLYVPILTGDAVDLILGPSNVNFAGVIRIVVLILVSVALTSLFQWIMSLCNNRMTFCMVRDIRRDAFAKLRDLPLSYLDSQPSGDLVSRIITDVDVFADGLLLGFTQLFTGVITILATLIIMLAVNYKIALVVFFVTPLSLIVASFIAKRTYSMFRTQSVIRGEQTSLIDEMIGQQKTVQAFSYESRAEDRFRVINRELSACSLKAIFYSSLVNPSTRFINSLVYAGVGLSGAFSVISGALSVGQLSCFLSYANQYTKPFNEISGVVTELQNSLASASRVFELISKQSESPDAADAVSPDSVSGRVDICNLCFSYIPERKLIENLNLSVKPGQRIAIVGPTGCGKTTVINLLMRFYDPVSGKIQVDGIDIRSMTRHSLRKNYGMVLQETWLRSGTVRDNIAMGRPDASEEEIVAAAKASYAHSFICKLPDGYRTEIGEDGGSLSQGQKQLLCIARVMLCHPPMLILDEATSSIDTRTEQKVQQAFSRLMEGRTSFIVAHRLSTIRESDLILMMKNGSVIEQGTHEDLLAKNGAYAELYRSQFAH